MPAVVLPFQLAFDRAYLKKLLLRCQIMYIYVDMVIQFIHIHHPTNPNEPRSFVIYGYEIFLGCCGRYELGSGSRKTIYKKIDEIRPHALPSKTTTNSPLPISYFIDKCKTKVKKSRWPSNKRYVEYNNFKNTSLELVNWLVCGWV